MYLQHELREVTEYRQTEALERIHYLHSLMKGNPGFIGTLSCRYLGRTDRYAWLRMWKTPADQTAFRQTQPAKDFAQTRPEGLYRPLPGAIGPGLNWESVIENPGESLGKFLVRNVFSVARGREVEFIERRQRYDAVALKFPGIDSLLTFRSIDRDTGNQYLMIARAGDRDAYNKFLESPQAASYRESLPAGLYETLTAECYEVVDEITAMS